MPVTMKQVRACLDPEEPNYPESAKLGAEAVPHLKKLVAGADAMLASKAAYLASLIPVESSLEVLENAARHGDATVRVAAAAAMSNVPGDLGSDVLAPLVGDADVGVRKVALASVRSGGGEALRARVEEAARSETEPGLQALSLQALERIGGAGSTPSTFASGVAPEPDEPGDGFGGGSVDGGSESMASGPGDDENQDGMGGGGDDSSTGAGPAFMAGAGDGDGGAGMGGGGEDMAGSFDTPFPGDDEDGMGGGEMGGGAERPGVSAFGGGSV